MWESGQQIGDYQLVASLRAGGMATLFLARRTGAAGFSRHVAIKVVHPQLAQDAQFRTMFLDEALLSSRIQHPNVVHVEELGECQGSHYLVMEYVHGCSLSQLQRALLARGRRLAPAFAVRIAMLVAEGLHAAHETCDEQGRPLHVVHRDVSPENVLLAYAGHVKLIDFGIAKAYGQKHRTQEGLLKGKFRYMAPEQAYSKPVDRRTDIYQLGIVLWELLTLRRLFDAQNDVQLLEQVRAPRVQAPSTRVKGIPPALDAVVMAALDPDPQRRPKDAQIFSRMLGKALPEALQVDGGALSELTIASMQEQRDHERTTLPPEVFERLDKQVQTAPMGSGAPVAPGKLGKFTVENTSPYGSDVGAPGSAQPVSAPAQARRGRRTAVGFGTGPVGESARSRDSDSGRGSDPAGAQPRKRRIVRIASEIKTTITSLTTGARGARPFFWLAALGAIGLGGVAALVTLSLRPQAEPPTPLPAMQVPAVVERPDLAATASDPADGGPPRAALAPLAPLAGDPAPTAAATDPAPPARRRAPGPSRLPAPVDVDGTPLLLEPGF